MTRLPFLDTNVLVRHVAGDEPDHSPRSTAYFESIESGAVSVRTADTVIFEAVYSLQSFYKIDRATIRDAILPIIELSGVKLPGKASYRYAFDLFVKRQGLSFGDCYHLALMKRLRLTEIVTFDRKINRIPGITRVEPS